MAVYTYKTIGNTLGEFQGAATVELELLTKVTEAWKKENKTEEIPIIQIVEGTGFTLTNNGNTVIGIPLANKTLAAMPVHSLSGTSTIGHTFAFYDEKSVLVHEISHYILDLLSKTFHVTLDV